MLHTITAKFGIKEWTMVYFNTPNFPLIGVYYHPLMWRKKTQISPNFEVWGVVTTGLD